MLLTGKDPASKLGIQFKASKDTSVLLESALASIGITPKDLANCSKAETFKYSTAISAALKAFQFTYEDPISNLQWLAGFLKDSGGCRSSCGPSVLVPKTRGTKAPRNVEPVKDLTYTRPTSKSKVEWGYY